ncbi:Glutamyl- or glutaminyl-tRNA synthetase (GlnS) (PDB:1EUQ) [Commensalibacter communis]|uniref:Glutamate--tRNA ligase n=1 Tax=Commensalibacter communis TaxID=2972786 RepID=A0A9W4TN32_9PROT|nr:glutamate--tRNA ligase [Commensalibacter communis]CAI3926802.1 Glutamyl- or glutaminyl-tRNA synthetase (GlnS) (PDB:1EUQ) [Commensalibacter communis]CAI3928319.1 Glutamyl- or glutaminyl-tRNA synthetase (GlnS) (PDB:1EUQ) [Commensalibacter communis]CAI3934184.1 Glutamyl- or glutaminyl-tRNA synthetase (GlnS) (PDB:1EUQ) [Commensalibacter communis]CAI3934698.1 Glutamyl- or glutaminyl-tRNA synthetase (GlnS) (PDB:1EUQ) [Commensalibacter communis]
MKLRFAPSPTGLMHVGNARLAVANALYARRHGGKFMLRIDDTDVERSKEEYVREIHKALEWFGFSWDEYMKQSDRMDRYNMAIERLKESGHLYPCFETKEELDFKRELRRRQNKPPIYDRAMLRLTPEQRASAEANDKVPHWRFKLSGREVKWDDLVMGQCRVKLTSISDPIMIKADGTVLYTLASVVDDLETDITHIIRGEDHVTNTGVQIDLIEALTGKPNKIRFAHLPLLMDADGGKLSKRLGSVSLKELREDGLEAKAIVSYLARLGTSRDPQLLSVDELAQDYDLSTYSKSPARFDIQQMLMLNKKCLHGMEFAEVKDRLPSYITEEFWNVVRPNIDLLSEARYWWDLIHEDMIPEVAEEDKDYLQQALDCLPEDPWSEETWGEWTAKLKDISGRKGKSLFHPLRIALTREEKGPEMKGMLPLIGRERVVRRLQEAVSR